MINLNLRDALEIFKNNTVGGRFAILLSKEREFIFGDGFYHTYTSPNTFPLEPKILLPVTPNICIFYTRPKFYTPEPRVVTLSLRDDEVEFINKTILVYSRDFVFYRSQKPTITANFKCREFLEYETNTHPSIEILS